jgi:hypothetical protein
MWTWAPTASGSDAAKPQTTVLDVEVVSGDAARGVTHFPIAVGRDPTPQANSKVIQKAGATCGKFRRLPAEAYPEPN